MGKNLSVLLGSLLLVSCASSIDKVMFGNASKVYIFTKAEQDQMSEDGSILTMVTPSELKAYFQNAHKITKPTGAVNYCGSGMSALVKSRRENALEAIDKACGGKNNYSIRSERPGFVAASKVGSLQIGSECNKPLAIYFRCHESSNNGSPSR